jgi:hypothetical protein
MKKYEVPVMKLHKLKTSSILAGSDPFGAKEGAGESSTQKYIEEENFNAFDE